MKPSATLARSPEGKSDRVALRLSSVRMKHMLDQAHAIIDLCADGREKLTGAYIFDRHYIFSLVDRIIDLSREMVFDASVTAPDGIRSSYAAFDNCKSAAEKLFLKNTDTEDADDAADGFEDTVEYRLLQRALNWIGCPEETPGVSVIGLLDRVLRHVFGAFEKSATASLMPYRLDIPCAGITHRIACVDMDGAVRSGADQSLSLDDLQCRPLSLLVAGACPDADPAPSSDNRPVKNWWALAGSEDVSIFGTAAGSPVWLDADITADDDGGHVLLWSTAHKIDPTAMPPDCRAALPSAEVLLWKSGTPDGDPDQVLTSLAGVLLADAE